MPEAPESPDVQVNVENNPAPPHGPDRTQEHPSPDAGDSDEGDDE